MFPLLLKFGLVQRTYTYTMDGGANLASTTGVLDHGVPLENIQRVCCKATGSSKPNRPQCIAHAINGACNGAVRQAKESTQINVKAILEKLQSCITYIKKSSKGWNLFLQACKFVGDQIKKVYNPCQDSVYQCEYASAPKRHFSVVCGHD